ncbi:MAG: sugar ABC transporter permease [Anaerolineaceae bacterium]|nr:MAG: sugar ABC transporter permease [Anaerolineaceae bacterium]
MAIKKVHNNTSKRNKKGFKITNQKRDAIAGLLFLLPWIIGFFTITCYPLIYSIVISFNQVAIKPGAIELEPIGLEYFRQALLVDAEFPTKLLLSLISVALGTPLVVVFALIIAILLNRKFRGRAIFRLIFFIPVIIMSGPVMTELLTESSAMNINFNLFGIIDILHELEGFWALMLISFLGGFVRILWFTGVQMIIFLAALQKIDNNMYEAASIDGATSWEMFWRITLPYIRPIIMLNSIYTIVEMGTFSDDNTNIKIVNSIRDIARPYSYAAAMSWIYALCLLVMIIIVFLIFMDWKEIRRVRNEKQRRKA